MAKMEPLRTKLLSSLTLAFIFTIQTCAGIVCFGPTIEHGSYSVQGRSSVVGSLRTTGAQHGSRVDVTVENCPRGLHAQQPIRSQCQNGMWTPPWPTCERPRNPCYVPRTPPYMMQFINGSAVSDISDYEGATLPDGTWLVARCEDPGRYRLVGESRRLCTEGEWSAPEPTCERVSTSITSTGVPHVIASNGTIFIYPRPSAALDRYQTIFCQLEGGLEGSAQLTVPQSVSHVEKKNNGGGFWRRITRQYIHLNPILPAHSGNYSCSTSSSNAPLHTVEIIIKDITCPPPVHPANGSFIDRDNPWPRGHYTVAKRIYFECNAGFLLVGASQVYCTVDGWSRPNPTCTPTQCREISTPDNARMIGIFGYGRNIGDERAFFCNPGYIRHGYTHLLRCNEGGEWSAPVPTCERLPQIPIVRQTLCTRGDECESWHKCVITDPDADLYQCNCINPFQCHTTGPQVCGTDGRNYTSECFLKALACILHTGVDIAPNNDTCLLGPPTTTISYDNQYTDGPSASLDQNMDQDQDDLGQSVSESWSIDSDGNPLQNQEQQQSAEIESFTSRTEASLDNGEQTGPSLIDQDDHPNQNQNQEQQHSAGVESSTSRTEASPDNGPPTTTLGYDNEYANQSQNQEQQQQSAGVESSTSRTEPSPDNGFDGLEWGEWSQCSRTCGEGDQFRRQVCSDPSMDHQTCRHLMSTHHRKDLIERQSCHEMDCKVRGHWGSWGAWQPCSSTCGPTTGFQVRNRTCIEVVTENERSFRSTPIPDDAVTEEYCEAHTDREVRPCEDLPPCPQPEDHMDPHIHHANGPDSYSSFNSVDEYEEDMEEVPTASSSDNSWAED